MWFSSRSRPLRVGYEVSRDGESRSKDRLLSRYSDSAVVDFPNRAHGASEEGTHRRYLSNGEPFSFSTLSNESQESIQTPKAQHSSPVVSSLFSCVECLEHFKTDAEFWAHAKKEGHRPIACICGERFSGTYELDRHVKAQADKWWDTSHHARSLPKIPFVQPIRKDGVIGPVSEPTEYNIASEEYEVPKGEVNAEIGSESGVSSGYSPRAGGIRGNSVLTDLSSGDHAVVGGKSSGDTALTDISDDNIDNPGPMDEFTEAEYEYDSSDVGDHADLELATLIRGLSVEHTGAASGRESSSRNKTTPTTSSKAIGSVQLFSRSHALRRKRGRTQKNNGGSDDEGFLQPPSGKPTPGTRGGPGRSLACPFAKNDPRKHHACFSKKLSRIRDVKQHLTRKHTPEFYCFRCSTIFPDQADLEAHIGNVAGLFCTPSSVLEGVSQQQQQRLSRKSNPRHSEEEQWFSIWDILFPGSERPSSAYTAFGLSEDLCSYREYSHGRVMAAVVDGLQAGGLLATGEQDTMLEEVRRVVADQLESVFEQWLATPSFSSPSDTTSSNQQQGSAVSTRQLTPASSEDGGGGQEMPSGSQPSYRPSDDAEAIVNQHRANESMEQTDPGLRSDSSSYPQDTDQSVLGMPDNFDFEAWMAEQTQDTVMLNLDASHGFSAAPSFMQFGESGE